MATVHFYEKPGCVNNQRQKQLLQNAGHRLIVHNLLEHPWAQDRAKLRAFFGALPVVDWFNRNAPAIKNALINPELLTERQAIELMIQDPLLIRRPLLEVDGRRHAGFEFELIDLWLGLATEPVSSELETCPKTASGSSCQS